MLDSLMFMIFQDPSAVSLFGGRGSWTGVEQLRLLDAAELYSYGNWDLIAEHVKTRTADGLFFLVLTPINNTKLLPFRM